MSTTPKTDHRSFQKLPCAFRSADGHACKRWACIGSSFCFNHRPNPQQMDRERWQDVHPLARVADFHDVFHIVRETLNAVRQGRIPPQQAYATGYMVRVWMQVYRGMNYQMRDEALTRQMLPTLVDEEAALERELALRSSMPAPVKSAAAPRTSPLEPAALPVELDEEAAIEAAPLPHNADEAEAHFRELMAATPPAPRAPLDSYPGFSDLQQRPHPSVCHSEPAPDLHAEGAQAAGDACAPCHSEPAPCLRAESAQTAGEEPQGFSEISDPKSPIAFDRDHAHREANTHPGDSSPVPQLRDRLGMTAASGAASHSEAASAARCHSEPAPCLHAEGVQTAGEESQGLVTSPEESQGSVRSNNGGNGRSNADGRSNGGSKRIRVSKSDQALIRALLKKVVSEMGPILGPASEAHDAAPPGRKPNGRGSESS